MTAGGRKIMLLRRIAPACALLVCAATAMQIGGSMLAPPTPDLGEPGTDDLPEVVIPLLGPARRIKGWGNPKRFARDPHVNADLLTAHRLTIKLPDGRSISFAAHNTSILGDRGVVQDLYVRRPLGCVPFKEAVADLRRTMKELGIEPGEIMKKHMAEWGDDFPGYGEGRGTPYKVGTAMHSAFPGVHLGVEVTPHPKGGWFYLMIIGAEIEERYAAAAIVSITNFTDDLGKPMPKARLAAVAPGQTLPEVSITLPGKPRQVRGFDPGDPPPDVPLLHPNLFQPHHLTIHLPKSEVLALDARGVSLLYDDVVIYGVHVRRPMEPVPFAEAVADLRATMERMGVKPDEAMAKQMAAWPAQAPGFDTVDDPADYLASMALSDSVRLEARVLPDPKGRWFNLLTLIVKPEARPSGPPFK